jgi:hypothetical protein
MIFKFRIIESNFLSWVDSAQGSDYETQFTSSDFLVLDARFRKSVA